MKRSVIVREVFDNYYRWTVDAVFADREAAATVGIYNGIRLEFDDAGEAKDEERTLYRISEYGVMNKHD